MNEISSLPMDPPRTDLVEVNNNLAFRKYRKVSEVSISSVSSCQSDSSEEYLVMVERKLSAQDVIDKAEDKKIVSDPKRFDDTIFVFLSIDNSLALTNY